MDEYDFFTLRNKGILYRQETFALTRGFSATEDFLLTDELCTKKGKIVLTKGSSG